MGAILQSFPFPAQFCQSPSWFHSACKICFHAVALIWVLFCFMWIIFTAYQLVFYIPNLALLLSLYFNPFSTLLSQFVFLKWKYNHKIFCLKSSRDSFMLAGTCSNFIKWHLAPASWCNLTPHPYSSNPNPLDVPLMNVPCYFLWLAPFYYNYASVFLSALQPFWWDGTCICWEDGLRKSMEVRWHDVTWN